jgi:hypothetical protein
LLDLRKPKVRKKDFTIRCVGKATLSAIGFLAKPYQKPFGAATHAGSLQLAASRKKRVNNLMGSLKGSFIGERNLVVGVHKVPGRIRKAGSGIRHFVAQQALIARTL